MKAFTFDGDRVRVKKGLSPWRWVLVRGKENLPRFNRNIELTRKHLTYLLKGLANQNKEHSSSTHKLQHLNCWQCAIVSLKEAILPKINVDLSLLELTDGTRSMTPG